MWDGRCPGQDGRRLTASFYKCPACGAEVEIFSDESWARCSACGCKVPKDSAPSCAEWCAHARECLGEERWKRIKR